MITPKIVYYNQIEKNKIFPASIVLENNWKQIQKEAINVFKYTNDNVAKGYINNKDKFYEGWNTFPLRMFGQNIQCNMEMCPILSEILNTCKDQVPTAFFSIMEPHKRLDAHYGPFKGILRYHLGLKIPPGECFISVDDIKYYWKEGEGKLFDETYLHYVHNDTPYHRIILFLDVKRPFQTTIMNTLNDLILKIIELSPHNSIVVKKQKQNLLKLLAKQL